MHEFLPDHEELIVKQAKGEITPKELKLLHAAELWRDSNTMLGTRGCRLGLVKPDRVISLHRLPELAEVRRDGGTLQLGAMARLADICTAPAVREGWPLLAEAARRVATPAIRVSGTIGGNLCYAEAASDPAPALLCLEAQVRVAGAAGGRTVPVVDFFRGFYETALAPGEIVTAIRVPATPAGARSGYVKFTSRSAEDRPLVGVAALVVRDSSGRWDEVPLK